MTEENMEGSNVDAQLAVPEIKPPIINGVVRRVNLEKDILDGYVGDINVEGHVRGSAPGQQLNCVVYVFDDGEVVNDSNTYTEFASVDYTPVSESSYLLIEYHAPYAVSGSEDDNFRSRITVNGGEITWRNQTWSPTVGMSVRGAVLFPISMAYTNNGTNELTVAVSAARYGSDDDLTVNTNGAYLKITEIAR